MSTTSTGQTSTTTTTATAAAEGTVAPGEAEGPGQAGRVERLEQEAVRRRVTPAVDILETADETLLVADLPGVGARGLELEIQYNELRLRGRTDARLGQEPLDYVRSFRLPPGIAADDVTADLKNGVLTLKLPKPAELKPRRIDVRIG